MIISYIYYNLFFIIILFCDQSGFLSTFHGAIATITNHTMHCVSYDFANCSLYIAINQIFVYDYTHVQYFNPTCAYYLYTCTCII